MSGSHLSKEFFELVKAIGESKSKQEEDRIIMHEVGVLKRKMPEATVAREKMKEFLVRMIYVEMLGHDASFGYIKAVELTASQNLAQKRSGYLTASLTLSPTHEFRFMLVNQMQRDLNSSNMLEAAAALTALCKLATVDMIPAVMTDVVRLLKHDRELVRKKAAMVLHRMNQLDPDSVSHMGDHLRRMLCDKDPSVMGSALCLLHDLARVDAASYKDLVPSFVSILKQITEHRLPRDFDYHRMPAPWIQMRLLRILALLGRADRATSEGMYEVLMDVMRRADTGINVGHAVVYECVKTITTIYPNAPLLDAAAASVSRFICSGNQNLRYVGVTGLAAIVSDHPKYAQDHQMVVIDCLEDPDETLKRKTLDLLYTMTNPVNVEFIAEKLLSFLEQGMDSFWRQDLVKRITQCAERFAPSNSWYVGVITRVFRLAGGMVKPEVAHNLMQLIAEGSGEDEEADTELRRDAVDMYMDLLDTPAVHDQLMQVMAWVLGEYGSLVSPPRTLREASTKLCSVASGLSFRDPRTCGFVVTALMKLSAQSGEVSPPVAHLLTLYSQSKHSDLQQRCLEFLQLAREGPVAMAAVLPVDASCEDVEADENLSHLDGIVSTALAAGAVGYSPPAEADGDSDDEEASAMGGAGGSSFNLTPYARPSQPLAMTAAAAPQAPLPPPQSSGGAGTPLSTADIFASGPRLRPVSKVWGRPKPGEPQQQPGGGGGGGVTASGARGSREAAAATEAGGAAGGGYPSSAAKAAADPSSSSATGGYDSRRGSWGGSGGGGGAPPAQVKEDPIAAAQRAEKEKMAAMLFGGTGARTKSTASPAGNSSRSRISSASSASRPDAAPASAASAAAAGAATAVASTPSTPRGTATAAGISSSPPVAAAPVDLLDFMSMEAPPAASDNVLLGGVGEPSTTAAAHVRSASASPASLPSSPNQPGLDLLGVGGGGSPPPSKAFGANGSSSAAAAQTLDDLLGGGTGDSGGSSNGVGGGTQTALNNGGGSGIAGLGTAGMGNGEQAWPGASGQRTSAVGSPASGAAAAAGLGRSASADLDLSRLFLADASSSASPGGLRGIAGGGGGGSGFTLGGRSVRPLTIATGEFGKRWMACTGEKKAAGLRLSPGLGSPAAVAQRLAARLDVHTVEIIPQTAEGICAGQLDGGGVCLVHCKVWQARGTVDITVRASDAKLAEAAAAFAKTSLAQ